MPRTATRPQRGTPDDRPPDTVMVPADSRWSWGPCPRDGRPCEIIDGPVAPVRSCVVHMHEGPA